MDLRCLGHFRNLQRIDFYLNETFISSKINVSAYQEDEEEVPDLLPYFERACGTFLQTLWNFGGWHHPSQACLCCQLSEVRFHYRQPGSDDWKLVILPFEKNEVVLTQKEAGLERILNRVCCRNALKDRVGSNYLCH
jgi:hypothetical protein